MSKFASHLVKGIFAACLFIISACHRQPQPPTDINLVRPKLTEIKTVPVEIKRSDYKEALANQGAVQHLRLVPILSRADQGSAAPEYRVFNVVKGGAPYVLGLRDADVLVAANEYILYNPDKFKIYLNLLQNEKSASIELRRGGEQILYQYTFTE